MDQDQDQDPEFYTIITSSVAGPAWCTTTVLNTSRGRNISADFLTLVK